MTLCVTCPQEWVTVSNGLDTRYESALQEGKRVLEKYDCEWFMNFYEEREKICAYEFEQTPRISTYLYAVCAGPYNFLEDHDSMYPP